MDPHRVSLSLLFVLIEKFEETLDMVFLKRTLDHLRGFRVFLVPIHLVPAFHGLVRVKQDVTLPVI